MAILLQTCIELESVILYSAGEKPRTVLESITLFGAKRYQPYIMLKNIGIILNNSDGPTMKRLLNVTSL